MVFREIGVGRKSIKVEIADSFFKKIKGLMFRDSLPENFGMLFVFDYDGYHGIWMIGMKFPIDIIWIDKRKKIVDFVENAKPSFNTYRPVKKARYVLEINAGFVKRNKIRIGFRTKL